MTPESEKALRDWATSHQSVGLVQASQVLELFEELSHLRASRLPLRFLHEYDRIRITGKTSSPSDHPRVEKMIGTVAAVSVGKPDEPDAIKVWPDDEFVHKGEEKLWFCDAAIEELELLERYEE